MSAEHAKTDWSHTFTSTKLDPPALARGLVDRPDLLRRLVTSDASLILLDAPAGWGKSSLLSSWSHAVNESRPFAFVRLDADDNEPWAFWSYVVLAIYGDEGTVPTEVAAAVNAPGQDPLRTLVPSLINSVNGDGRSLVLALDDYHQITESTIHRSVEYLIEHAPRGLYIAIATRTDPPLPLARWRAAGSLEEVRLPDLRLSPGDTCDLLANRFGLELGPTDTELLHERTEGWPAGIQLAGVSLAGVPNPTEFITAFAGNDRNIADYLTSEVLLRQPEERARFLQATSVLQRMNAELCDYVLETTGSVGVLEDIERQNLFLVPLDSKREWFRYHHLFQEWLHLNLLINEEPTLIAKLHARAADWLQRHGAEEQAIDHLFAAGDVDAAAQIIERLLSRLAFIHEGPVRQWLPGISRDVAAAYPRISIAHLAQCLTRGDYAQARTWLATLKESLVMAGDADRDQLSPHVSVYQALHALPTRNLEVAEQGFRAVVESDAHGASAPAAYARGLLGLTLFWMSGPDEALPHLRSGAQDRRRLSMGDTGITAYVAAAHAEIGEWALCESAIAEAFALPDMRFSRFPDMMPAHYANARLLHHRGRPTEAIDQAQRGLEQAKAWSVPAYTAWGYLVMFDIASTPADKRRFLMEAELHGASYASHHYLSRAIAASRQQLDSRWPVIASDGAVAEALTRREIEVLRFFLSELSLRDIGKEMDITLNTAKGYAKAIYRKLAVSSRSEAVSVAKQTGLI